MQAVILAGGLGKRLRPFTQTIPKPLLPLGEKSILEIQISYLREAGIGEIFLATNYKSHYIKNFFGDGSHYGVKITISEEPIPHGTCGPLKLLEDKLHDQFLVMNGDILTTANFKAIFDFSRQHHSPLTVVTKELVFPFDYGHVSSKDGHLLKVEEKPNLKLEIIAGIYMFRKEILDFVPINQYFGMDQLINKLIELKKAISVYPLEEYWLDIGRIEDYHKAEEAYKNNFFTGIAPC